MNLQKISIYNYKCIDELHISLNSISGSDCYSLLGINEAGKSSILQAINLIDNPSVKYPEDYLDKRKNIEIVYSYKIESYEEERIRNTIQEKLGAPDEFIKKISFENIILKRVIENKNEEIIEEKVKQKNGQFKTVKKTIKPTLIIQEIDFKQDTIQGYCIEEDKLVEKDEDVIDLNELIQEVFPNIIWAERHRTLFWSSMPKYLITKQINLAEFSEDPKSVSIPLFNSFKLLGIEEDEIEDKISELNSPTEISNFEDELSVELTKFIRNIWKDHPITIKIKITNGNLSFLIEDEKIAYNAKVVNQRSDGFKQFISFLLSVAIENKNEDLSYKILLLDEPEMHLHPTAQLDLLRELLNISKIQNKNIIFYSTHSPYLIDRRNLNRSYKVTKPNNKTTSIEKITRDRTTYSEINYEVFNLPTTDYHNELYGFIEDANRSLLTGLDKDRDWINTRTGNTDRVSICTYIRHSIHHPENTQNRNFDQRQLKKSIEILRKLKEQI